MRNTIYRIAGDSISVANKISSIFHGSSPDTSSIVLFNPSVMTENIGDQIIMRYCRDILCQLFPDSKCIDVSTHEIPSEALLHEIQATDLRFVCGTNLLTSHIEKWWNWRLPDGFRKKLQYRNVILFGVGWNSYQDECSDYTRMIYKSLLHPSFFHSVRDQYSADKLRKAGIKNVLNTGCPTMWRFTPSFCKSIPAAKAKSVITSVTDYRRDIDADNAMLRILKNNYDTIYIWLQGKKDAEYLSMLHVPDHSVLIDSIDAFDEKLVSGEVDYVGTRLHAGIYALNHQVRSIVIGVDNRSAEIASDTGLPVIERSRISAELDGRIHSDWKTEIQLKQRNIDSFIQQFKEVS